MKITGFQVSRRWMVLGGLAMGTVAQFGFVDSCDDRLINATRYLDPCGTFLANCAPGSFLANAAELGDYCVDPSCTVPGACPDNGQPLGTIRDICP